jgi:hypothetical protein
VEAVRLSATPRAADPRRGPTLAAAFSALTPSTAWVFVAAKAQGGTDAARLGTPEASLGAVAAACST